MTLHLGLCVLLGAVLSYGFLAASTPMQRLFAAQVIRRALELSREKQSVVALEQNQKDAAQFTRELQGAGKIDFALLLACSSNFLRGLSQAIAEHAGCDPAADRLAEAVADRVAERLAGIKPRMAVAALAVADREAVCR